MEKVLNLLLINAICLNELYFKLLVRSTRIYLTILIKKNEFFMKLFRNIHLLIVLFFNHPLLRSLALLTQKIKFNDQ